MKYSITKTASAHGVFIMARAWVSSGTLISRSGFTERWKELLLAFSSLVLLKVSTQIQHALGGMQCDSSINRLLPLASVCCIIERKRCICNVFRCFSLIIFFPDVGLYLVSAWGKRVEKSILEFWSYLQALGISFQWQIEMIKLWEKLTW